MQSFFDAVRKAMLPALWSSGVKLVRESAVSAVSASASELVYRVRAPGHAIAPTVTLYVNDGEWSCDCGGKVDPCAHVAAATIAAKDGLRPGAAPAPTKDAKEGKEPKSGRAAPARGMRLLYKLGKRDRLLTLNRSFLHADGREEPLGPRRSLASDVARNNVPNGLDLTHDDLTIDRMLGVPMREVVPLDRISQLFDALSQSEVTFLGEPTQVSSEPLSPRATLEDGKNGCFVLRLDRDPAITDVIALGVARAGGLLRPLSDTATTGAMLDNLPLIRTFSKDQAAELSTNVLPELEKKLSITIVTKRLPRTKREARPRIAMDLSHRGHTLSVFPTLVYGDPPIARVDGDKLVALGKSVPVRRVDLERSLVHELRDSLNLVPGRRVDFDGQDAARFAQKLRNWQAREGNGGDDSFAGEESAVEKRLLVPRVSMDDGKFDVVFEVEGGDTEHRADAAAVLRAWRDGLDLVPLDGGGWAPLPADWLSRFGDRVADLLAARDDEKKVPKAALPELAALADALEMPRPFGMAELAPLFEGFEGIPKTPLPEGLTATLRAYQEQGVDWLAFLRDAGLGGVLADDMGLGKTLQTICVLRGRALVVCPKSVVYNWQDELRRFRPGLKASIFHGQKRAVDKTADVTLTTYATLRLDVTRLAEEPWDVVVLDEAQAIKNPDSQTARAAFRLPSAFRLALSGTPVENRLDELWSLMHFANPGLLGGRGDFDARYSTPLSSGDPEVAKRLRSKIRPFVLRRLKRDVIPELPSRTDAVMHVELDDKERDVYDAVRASTRKEVAAALAAGGNVLVALEALLRLRQASCHAALVPGQTAESSSKVERLLEALEEATADGHKALVFSQWTSLLDKVEPHLKSAGIGFARLDGTTRDRGAVVSSFQSEGGPPVMLVSLKAGGTGLNLTAADHVFLLDPWWNPAVEDQAADRAHRIGQERPVMVYRLVAKDTVEERILALQEKKRQVANVALGGADHAGGITREELLALLD